MKIYYNEFDKKKCVYLSRLMRDGLIPKGEIDERPIQQVRPSDIVGFDQCHFFAGIGVWAAVISASSFARTSGVWTGSCPCQPYSRAGKIKANNDERHLLPVWARLIEKSKPSIVFGEQVENAIAHGWLDEAFSDLENQGYACAAAVLQAASVSAAHERARLFFGCDAGRIRLTPAERLQCDHICKEAKHKSRNVLSRMVSTCSWDNFESASDFCILDDGAAGNVGLFHAIGDAIVFDVALEFVEAFGDTLQ